MPGFALPGLTALSGLATVCVGQVALCSLPALTQRMSQPGGSPRSPGHAEVNRLPDLGKQARRLSTLSLSNRALGTPERCAFPRGERAGEERYASKYPGLTAAGASPGYWRWAQNRHELLRRGP